MKWAIKKYGYITISYYCLSYFNLKIHLIILNFYDKESFLINLFYNTF